MTSVQIRVHRIVMGCWWLMLLLVGGRQLQQSFTVKQLLWGLFFSLPLIACFQGLWRGRRYTHKWATMCVLPYFVAGITEGVANSALRSWALWLLGVSLLWFFSMVAYLRVTPNE